MCLPCSKDLFAVKSRSKFRPSPNRGQLITFYQLVTFIDVDSDYGTLNLMICALEGNSYYDDFRGFTQSP